MCEKEHKENIAQVYAMQQSEFVWGVCVCVCVRARVCVYEQVFGVRRRRRRCKAVRAPYCKKAAVTGHFADTTKVPCAHMSAYQPPFPASCNRMPQSPHLQVPHSCLRLQLQLRQQVLRDAAAHAAEAAAAAHAGQHVGGGGRAGAGAAGADVAALRDVGHGHGNREDLRGGGMEGWHGGVAWRGGMEGCRKVSANGIHRR